MLKRIDVDGILESEKKDIREFGAELASGNSIYLLNEKPLWDRIKPDYKFYFNESGKHFEFEQWNENFDHHTPFLMEIEGGIILPRKSGLNKQHSLLDKNMMPIDAQFSEEGVRFHSSSGRLQYDRESRVVSSLDLDVIDFSDKTVFLMSSLQSHENYYHWHIFYFQFLIFLNQIKIRKDAILITPRLDSKMRKAISAAGCNLSNVLEYEGSKAIKGKSVVTSSYSFCIPRLSKEALPIFQKVSNAISSELEEGHSFSELIYISRKDTFQRQVINEDELVTELGKLGFVSYQLSELSYAEQITLFKGAKVVVAPHGAGLTNLLFSEGCKDVVELFSTEWVHSCYRDLCSVKNIAYSCLFFEPEDASMGRESHHRVDVEVIVNMLKYLR